MDEGAYDKAELSNNGAKPGADLAAQAPSPEPSTHKSVYATHMTRTNIVLVVLFVAGVATVYALSLHKGPAEASAREKLMESTVDSAILRLKQTPAPGPGRLPDAVATRDLLRNFAGQIIRWQVPLSKLPKNPFVFVRPTPAVAQVVEVPPEPARPEKTPEQITYEQAMIRLKQLHLQSVMMGSEAGVAIISNNLLTVGQQIDGFTVKRIDRQAVVLTWQGQEFVLKMTSTGG